MKVKLLTLILFVTSIQQSMNAQTVYYTQNFSGGTQPAGWCGWDFVCLRHYAEDAGVVGRTGYACLKK